LRLSQSWIVARLTPRTSASWLGLARPGSGRRRAQVGTHELVYLEANLTALERQTQGRFEQYERRQTGQERISDAQAELVLRLPKPRSRVRGPSSALLSSLPNRVVGLASR
jgi:hypothetical protein